MKLQRAQNEAEGFRAQCSEHPAQEVALPTRSNPTPAPTAATASESTPPGRRRGAGVWVVARKRRCEAHPQAIIVRVVRDEVEQREQDDYQRQPVPAGVALRHPAHRPQVAAPRLLLLHRVRREKCLRLGRCDTGGGCRVVRNQSGPALGFCRPVWCRRVWSAVKGLTIMMSVQDW